MKRTIRRGLAATALTAGLVLAGAAGASAQSGGDYEQAHADVNAGNAYVVGLQDQGNTATWQFGYGDPLGTMWVETFTYSLGQWTFHGGSSWDAGSGTQPPVYYNVQ